MHALHTVLQVLSSAAPLKDFGAADTAADDPMQWVVPAISLFGLLVGLVMALGRDSSEAAVAAAASSTVASAPPGELVRLQGTLSSGEPVRGPVTGRELAFLSGNQVVITVHRDQRNGRSYQTENATITRDWGDGLTLTDGTGSILVDPTDCEMVLPKRVRALANKLPDFARLIGPGIDAYDERGVPNGAQVLLVGRVEDRHGQRVLAGGPEMLLSSLDSESLRKRGAAWRVGGAVAAVSGAIGLGQWILDHFL